MTKTDLGQLAIHVFIVKRIQRFWMLGYITQGTLREPWALEWYRFAVRSLFAVDNLRPVIEFVKLKREGERTREPALREAFGSRVRSPSRPAPKIV